MDLNEATENVLDTISLSKSEVWAYEREWRVIAGLRDKTQKYEILPFAREEIGKVYLGCRMANESRQEIINVTRCMYGTATIYQTEKHGTEFALTFREVA